MYHFFYGGPFSQWYPSKFTVDDFEYNCAEQYMMAEKARLFQDYDILDQILKADHPKQQKALGREVRNFDVDCWNKSARKIVYDGNYEKFNQNPDLKKQLFAKKEYILVEASPYDKIWGIGLGITHPDRFDRDKWRGKNWLGEVLMMVRDCLYFGLGKEENIDEYWS